MTDVEHIPSTELVVRRSTREVMLPDGELVDVVRDAGRIAELLDRLEEQERVAATVRAELERIMLEVMDSAALAELEFEGGVLRKDPVGAGGKLEWDDQRLAALADLAPEDPELAERFRMRLAEALRPEYRYKPLKAKLDAIAAENPDAAAIIREALHRRPAKRHVHVNRKRAR